MRLTSIDPSINFCGISIMDNRKLIDFGLSKETKGDYIDRINNILSFLDRYNAGASDILAIEVPEYFYNDKNKKSIMLLHKTIGSIVGYYIKRVDKIIEIPVSTWKGTESKEQTLANVSYWYPESRQKMQKIAKSKQHNAADAIALGHFVFSCPDYYVYTRDRIYM